jgi:hypothetical protein
VWIEGRAVERKGVRNIPLQSAECQADRLAKEAFQLAISGGSAMEGDFPFEVV